MYTLFCEFVSQDASILADSLPPPPLSLLLYAQWYPFMQKNGIWMCSRGVYGDGDKANIYWKWSFERIVHAAFTNFVYWILIRRRIGDCDYWIVTRCSESEIWMKPFDMNERPTIVYSGFMHTHKEKNVDIYIFYSMNSPVDVSLWVYFWWYRLHSYDENIVFEMFNEL